MAALTVGPQTQAAPQKASWRTNYQSKKVMGNIQLRDEQIVQTQRHRQRPGRHVSEAFVGMTTRAGSSWAYLAQGWRSSRGPKGRQRSRRRTGRRQQPSGRPCCGTRAPSPGRLQSWRSGLRTPLSSTAPAAGHLHTSPLSVHSF